MSYLTNIYVIFHAHHQYHIKDIRKILTSSMKSPFDLSRKAFTLSVHLPQKNSSPSRPLSSRKLPPNMFLLISAMEVVVVDPFRERVLVGLFRERDLA